MTPPPRAAVQSRKQPQPGLPPQSAPQQHRHIRSDSWRNAFYHPPAPLPNNVTDWRNRGPSMADVAQLAVSLEGIDMCELGVGSPSLSPQHQPPTSMDRRRHPSKARARRGAAPPLSPSSPSLSRNRLARRAETAAVEEMPAGLSASTDFTTQQDGARALDPYQSVTSQTTMQFHLPPSHFTNYGSTNNGLHPSQAQAPSQPTPYSHVQTTLAPRNHMTPQQLDDVQAFSQMATKDPKVLPAAAISDTTDYIRDNELSYPSPFVSATTETLSALDAQYSDSEDSKAYYGQQQPLTTDDSMTEPSLPPDFVQTNSVTCCGCWIDIKGWLIRDAKLGPDGLFYFDKWADWSLPGLARHYFYNPLEPEFTSLQQFNWAIVIGIVMGLYTAIWKYIIDSSVDFVWVTVPTALLQAGFFTELHGSFPLYHYMWITPACFAAVLSYLLYALPKLPDQNDWITNLHKRGVQDHTYFWHLFLISTASMASGLSLGPELPLVLTAGMFGSWLATVCQQSLLQARILNLTAAGAAVGGFFGFPMAGALFVMELPHRMGLQYFEALSPATISSIVAVLCNRILTKNDVTGYYKYPFLSMTLPSEIFTSAILYGLYGALVGTIYVSLVKRCKGGVYSFLHSWRKQTAATTRDNPTESEPELDPLLSRRKPSSKGKEKNQMRGFLGNWRGLRIALVGACSGAIVGWIGVFLPHVMFWGEAQLQSLIDEGRTPLPVFGLVDEPTAGLTARGFCLIDSDDEHAIRKGFDLSCTFMISLAKIVVTGISLGIGIGGQFWGPLFVGCAAGQFLVHLIQILSQTYQFPSDLAAHPCVVILCSMGASHVVTFRAHLAIMLILTLTISTFDSEIDPNGSTAGDYSAVFPLLVVSVFVSLMTTRSTIFYQSQKSRGDITAVPEVLCEPGMQGRPLIFEYDGDSDESSFDNVTTNADSRSHLTCSQAHGSNPLTPTPLHLQHAPPPHAPLATGVTSGFSGRKVDEVGSICLESSNVVVGANALSADDAGECTDGRANPETNLIVACAESVTVSRDRCNSTSSARGALVRISCYGELQDYQPSLMDQARKRAASADRAETHRRVNSQGSHQSHSIRSSNGRHRRKDSESSVFSYSNSPIPSYRRVSRSSLSTDANETNRPMEAAVFPTMATALNAECIDDVFNTQVESMSDDVDLSSFSNARW